MEPEKSMMNPLFIKFPLAGGESCILWGAAILAGSNNNNNNNNDNNSNNNNNIILMTIILQLICWNTYMFFIIHL